ncbi:MAG: 16S rRNA (uracil(1498)-N(3))-methyltransferase [Chloroflexi bacterium]|nr:16S rRNA (uracil(1498)-N(3))-methyltransferase [Chloroflexota bacterium]
MHRFFISPDNISAETVILTGEQARQIAYVLRMKTGDVLVVLDNVGWEYVVEITAVTRHQITAQIQEKQTAVGEPSVHITLYMALLKRDKFEWVLQKCTEVGVGRFVPVVTQRSLVQDDHLKPNKLARWQKIIMEAAEQSRRGRMPTLAEPLKFGVAVTGLDAAVALIPWEKAKDVGIRSALAGKTPISIALFIGPEGGFTPDEIELAQQYNVQPITLGKRILRAETAAIVASSVILYECE